MYSKHIFVYQEKFLIRKIPMNLHSPFKLYSKMYLNLKTDLRVLRKSLKKILKRINRIFFYFMVLSNILLSVRNEFAQNVEFNARHDKKNLFRIVRIQMPQEINALRNKVSQNSSIIQKLHQFFD